MTLSHEQFREHLLGYVYGELQGSEREAFEASLAASEEYRRELAAVREVLETTRAGLSALQETPPARVKQAVLAAAAQQAPAAVATPTNAKVIRLFAPKWIAVLSVAAVVGLAVLSRRSDETSRVSEQPAPRAAPVSPAPVHEPTAPLDDDNEAPAGASPEGAAQPASDALRRSGPGAPTAPASSRGGALGALREQTWREGREALPKRAARPQSPAAAPSYAPAPESAPGKGAAQPPAELQHADDSNTFKRERKAKTQELAAPQDGAAAAAPTRSATPSVTEASRSEEESSPIATASTAEISHAREHLIAKRWARAREAYQKLLRQYPQDPRADEWRKQLQAAERADGAP